MLASELLCIPDQIMLLQVTVKMEFTSLVLLHGY